MEEIWKDIEGYEGYYQVSNLGRVRSKVKILSTPKKENGYLVVGLYKNDGGKKFYVHRLVAKHFIKDPENMDINHINGIKSDNIVTNLEIVSRSENLLHAVKIGLFKKGSECSYSKLTDEEVFKIKYEYKGYTLKQLSEIFNVHVMTLSDIRRGKNWKHI